MNKQHLTRELAIEMYETEWWKKASPMRSTLFQLMEPLLCMPFDIFHANLEKLLDTPVLTHQLGSRDFYEKAIEELWGHVPDDEERKRFVLSVIGHSLLDNSPKV